MTTRRDPRVRKQRPDSSQTRRTCSTLGWFMPRYMASLVNTSAAMALLANRTPAPAKSAILIVLMGSLHLVGNSHAGRPTSRDRLGSNHSRIIKGNERRLKAPATAVIGAISLALFRIHLPTEDRIGTLSCWGRSALWPTFVAISFKCELEKSDEKNVDGFCGRCGLIGRNRACDGSRW